MGFVVHSYHKTHRHSYQAALWECRDDEVGEITYIDLRERKVVEKAIKKSEEERSRSYLAQWIEDLVGRMHN